MRNKPSKKRQTTSSKMMVEQEAIAKLAYEFYVQRGYEDGHDLDDWLKAERMLVEKIERASATRPYMPPMRRLEDQFVLRR